MRDNIERLIEVDDDRVAGIKFMFQRWDVNAQVDQIMEESGENQGERTKIKTPAQTKMTEKPKTVAEVTGFSTTPSGILFSINSTDDGSLPNLTVMIGEDEYFFPQLYVGQDNKSRLCTTIPQIGKKIKTQTSQIVHNDFDTSITGRKLNLEHAIVEMLEKFLVILQSDNPKSQLFKDSILKFKKPKEKIPLLNLSGFMPAPKKVPPFR